MKSPNLPCCRLCGRTDQFEKDYRSQHYATEEVKYSTIDAETDIKLCITCDKLVRHDRQRVYTPALEAVVNPWKAEESINSLETNRPGRREDVHRAQVFRWIAKENLLDALERRRDWSNPRRDSSCGWSIAESHRGLLEEQRAVNLDEGLPEFRVRGPQQENRRRKIFMQTLMSCLRKVERARPSLKRIPRQR